MRLVLLFAALATAASAQVNTERMRKYIDQDGVFLTFDAAAALAAGNTDFVQIGLGGRADARFGQDRAFLVGRFDLAENDDNTFVDKSFAHLRYNTDLAPRLVGEAFTQIERNRQQQLDARTLLGAGLRYEIVDADSAGLAAGVTPMFEYEVLDDDLGEESTTHVRISTYLSGRYTLPSGASLSTATYFQPQAADPSDHRLLTQVAFEVPVTRWVRLRIRANVRYDSDPPVGVENTDLTVENGLSLVIPAN